MGIKQDAGELLLYYYTFKRKGERFPGLDAVLEITRWEPHRLNSAFEYCEQTDVLNVLKSLGSHAPGLQNRVIMDVTAIGVDLIEGTTTQQGSNQFNAIFNLSINIEKPTLNLTFGSFKLF